MPLYHDFSNLQTTVLVWKYAENETLDSSLLIEEENRAIYHSSHPRRQAEMLLIRKMLKSVLPGHKLLYRGREPFLFPEDRQVSVTHSFPYAALAVSSKKVGIDLEPFQSKILRIKDKFVVPDEMSFIEPGKEVEYLTVIWAVKESLYKIHHSNYWSLKKHYEVKPFQLHAPKKILCRVHDDHVSDLFWARVEFFDNYCLTIVV